ncbi:response regulator transcription factor [Aquabacterium sp. A7-Y]|uniref:response regulator n=1 Tax=Aquabacterium sp. A7-Y TaxID=1349605 RepID=UPI00223D5616|nr:response regulator transcription factor [Aquabacterium sp. A7-Y]MCW7538988.1 response regulator transcription factor [Aquabacterium sp. A7-Y]
MKRTILVVDDDQKIRSLLKTYLEKNQYEVRLAHDGVSFLSEFERFRDELSLCVLDVMLPDTDGFALCQQVRRRSEVPVIMLTASADETDRVVGLELGADDYIGKPFSPRELLARIKAIHRRTGLERGSPPRYYRFHGFVLDALERALIAPDGSSSDLTGMDYQLLKLFLDHPGEVLDRNRLAEATRGRDLGPLDRALDVQVSRLRQRLHDDGKQPSLIKTVRGIGYVLSTTVEVGA